MNGTRAWAIALFLFLSLSGPACSSGGGASLTEIQQALEDCTQEGVIDLVRVLGNLGALFDAAEGNPLPDELTFDPTANPNEFSYVLTFPRGGNGPDDTRVAGLIAFSADPGDGIGIGDTADLTGTITSLGGPLTGSFDLDLTFTEANAVSITGTLMLDNADGCDFDITITGADPLVLLFGDFGPALTANFLGLEVSGTLGIAFSVFGENFDAIVTLLAGNQDAMVSGDLNGEPLDPFSVEVFPAPDEVEALLSCFFFGAEGAFAIIEDLGDVFGAIGDPQSFPNIDIQPGTALGTFDFTADFGAYTVEGTFAIPVSGTGTGSATFTFASVTPMIVGVSAEFSGSGTLFLNFVGGDPVSLYGTSTLMTDDGCMVDVEIDQDNPMLLSEEPFDTGLITFTVKALGNTMTLVVDLDALVPEDQIVDANINGISIPGELIIGTP